VVLAGSGAVSSGAVAARSASTLSLVQEKVRVLAKAGAATVTLSAAATAGDLLIAVGVSAPGRASITGPSGFTLDSRSAGSPAVGSAAVWSMTATGGEKTLRFFARGARVRRELAVFEIAGLASPATVDGTVAWTHSGRTVRHYTQSYGSSPAAAGELALAFFSSTTATSRTPQGWSRLAGRSRPDQFASFYFEATGTTRPSITAATLRPSGRYLAGMVVFKPAVPPSTAVALPATTTSDPPPSGSVTSTSDPPAMSPSTTTSSSTTIPPSSTSTSSSTSTPSTSSSTSTSSTSTTTTSSTTTSTTPTTTPSTTATTQATSTAVCGNGPAGQATKVMVIFEENEDESAVVGSSSAPYINSIASQCGLATNYTALEHPSLPNYLEMMSGVSYDSSPWTADCGPGASGCTTANPSVFSQTANWKSYVESMPSNCDTSDNGDYETRHNPAVYYSSLTDCSTNDVPLNDLAADVDGGTLPTISTVTPNGLDDGENGTLASTDSWLSATLPSILAGPDYQSGRLAIIIVWDEGSGSGDVPSNPPLIVLSEGTPVGATVSTAFNDYSITATIDSIAGLPQLGSGSPLSGFGL